MSESSRRPQAPLAQPLRAGEIRQVLGEIRPRIEGGRVSRVVLPGSRRLVLEVRRGQDLAALLLSVEPQASRLHLTAPPPARGAGTSAPPFFALARRELEGRWLLQLLQPGDDRLVALRFGPRPGEAGAADQAPAQERWLLAELTGRHANLFLTTGAPPADQAPGPPPLPGQAPFGHILGSLASSASTRRDLRPGQRYLPLLPTVTERPGEPAGGVGEPLPLREEDLLPPRFGLSDPAALGPSLSAQIEAHFEAELEREHELTLRTRIEAALRKGLARAIRRGSAVRGDLLRHGQGDLHRRKGDALLQHLRELGRGATSVRLADPYEPDRELVIELDPARTPQQNAAEHFRRHRKAKQGLAVAQSRLDEALAEAARLEREIERLPGAPLPLLVRLAEGLKIETRPDQMARPARHQKLEERRRDAEKRALPYRSFRGRGGEDILVGKGARENDLLTFKVARGNDVWLHARDARGAHVVIKLPPGKAEPHAETLLDAATLAAHYSDLRREAQVDVTTTRCKHVRRAKGASAAPGAVYLSEPRTIRVRLEEARLQRLFRAADGAPGDGGPGDSDGG